MATGAIARGVKRARPTFPSSHKEKERKREGEGKGEGQHEEEDEEEDEEEEEEEDDEEDADDAAGQDVIVVGEESAQDGKEDGKRATSHEAAEAPAAKKCKSSTLSSGQQAFVNQFKPAVSKIAVKERKIPVRWVQGKQSTKKQGGRVHDVSVLTLAKRPAQFPDQFLSIMGGQLWCGACHSNVGSGVSSIVLHVKGVEHVKKVQIKTA